MVGHLDIYAKNGSVRCTINKWEFHDQFMGDQFLQFDFDSAVQIPFAIGDYAVYRGETFIINVLPTCEQVSKDESGGVAFKYSSVKLESSGNDLGKCAFLDITPTTYEYISSEGTNYTGSSVFTLYCVATTVTMKDAQGNQRPVTLHPVEYLCGVIQSNLRRCYGPDSGWQIHVNPDSANSDDKIVVANNWSCRKALEEVHNIFKLDYVIRGRSIYVGYTLQNVTGLDDDAFMFGYGKGYARKGEDGTSLVSIKKTSNSSQQIVTRLRCMGSSKNMPYRYYQKKYELPQALYVENLQLPNTYVGTGVKYDVPGLRKVLGDTNDAYIDKDDDAGSTEEGIIEGFAAWDGSNSDLEEIYPTIREATYYELRRATGITDIDGVSGLSAFPNYGDDERIDEILSVGSKCNIGDGIMPESDVIGETTETKNAEKTVYLDSSSFHKDSLMDSPYVGPSINLVNYDRKYYPGKYTLSGTNADVFVRMGMVSGCNPGYQVEIWLGDEVGEQKTLVYHHNTAVKRHIGSYQDIYFDNLPIDGTSIELESEGFVSVWIKPLYFQQQGDTFSFTDLYFGIVSETSGVEPRLIWAYVESADTFVNTPFTIFLKDLGFDIRNLEKATDDTPKIHLNTGACAGREFEISLLDAEQKTVGNKKGWEVRVVQRCVDDSIKRYFPSGNDPIMAGDDYVLIGVAMPDAYISMAEVRLLKAATDYLADNCDTKYIYEPQIDNIYVQRNYDNCNNAGTPEKSVYWNLYAGYKFSMYGMPKEGGYELIDNITIQTVTIREGESNAPTVEIVLNDDIEQTTIEKITTSVDRLYGSIFGGNGLISTAAINSTLASLVSREGGKFFVSKLKDDVTQGLIGFVKGIWVKAKGLFGIDSSGNAKVNNIDAEGDANVGGNMGVKGWLKALLGYFNSIQSENYSGNSISDTGYELTSDDGNGNSRLVVDNIVARMKFIANILEVRKLTSMGGNYVFSPATGVIEEVDYFNDNGEILGYEKIKVPWLLRGKPMFLSRIAATLGIFSTLRFERTTMSEEDWRNVHFFRCWLKADDGSTKTINTWRSGMLARCQTFDASQIEEGGHSGVYSEAGETWAGKNVQNKLYWRAVVFTGENITKENYLVDSTKVLDDGRAHNFIDLSNAPGMFLSDSDRPSAGDHIVCYGDYLHEDTSNVITIETVGDDAPCIRELYRVGYSNGSTIDWNNALLNKEGTRISPVAGDRFVAPEFLIEITNPDQTKSYVNIRAALDGISSEVKSLENGKNMFKTPLTWGGWAFTAMYEDESPEFSTTTDGVKVCSGDVGKAQSPSVGVNEGDTYTFSIYSDEDLSSAIGVKYGSGSLSWLTSQTTGEVVSAGGRTLYRYKVTVTIPAGNNSVMFYVEMDNLSIYAPQLELGSCTPFTASTNQTSSIIKQTADGISMNVKEISPSKNLLKGALSASGWKSFSQSYGTAHNAILSDGWITLGYSGDYYIVSQPFSIESGKEYAISFNAEGSSAISYLVVSTSLQTVASGTTSTSARRKATFTANATTSVMLFIHAAKIKNPQVEVGSTATDFIAGTTEISSGYNQTADNIHASVVTELGQTGIDISGSNREINLIADKVKFKNSAGTVDDKISIDPTTGTLHAVDGDFEGTVKASNFFRSLSLAYPETSDSTDAYYIGQNGEIWVFVPNGAKEEIMEDVSGSYEPSELEEISDFLDEYVVEETYVDINSLPDEIRSGLNTPKSEILSKTKTCTGITDFIWVVNNGSKVFHNYNVDYVRSSIFIPRPQDFVGKTLEITNKSWSNTSNYKAHAKVVAVEDNQGGSFATSVEIQNNAIVAYAGSLSSNLNLDQGYKLTLLSIGNQWLQLEYRET